MQILFRAFLAIYLGHLLADFVFQPNRLVEQKRRGKPSAYLRHGIIHYLSAALLIGFFIPGSLLAFRTHLVLAGLTLAHLLIDLVKVRLAAGLLFRDGAASYLTDQFAHFITVILAAWLLLPGVPFSALLAPVQSHRNMDSRFLAVPMIYIGVIFGGGYLIRFLTRSLSESVKEQAPGEMGEQLQNAGLYIGWLERFLILTALLLRSPAAVGLILTAKAITRYPEFKSARFAEYVLIGTLLSVSLAFVGAVFLTLFLGQGHFS